MCVTGNPTFGTVISLGFRVCADGEWEMTGRTGAPRRGAETRERLLEVPERAVLAKGFASTSIEELITEVGITKSGFFYHFGDKGGLAKAMMVRHLEHDR